ncbi:hypothetical protein QX213_21135 [Vibrio vulnificus]|uniref:hypothetical protein n=1 Tax=Vibrio vulnificus TaxID=672 RepID=UPI00287AA600|nr:hypothetical protein [Vibrio vulnificus]MDS1846428.1 hypothetical protein [Vibrio vulnificus]
MLKKCHLCCCKKELCNSHAIPDSVFRSLFRKGSGQAVELSSKESEPNRMSQDSWAADLLCSSCEERLNNNYDQYGLNLLRGKVGEVKKDGEGVHFSNIDTLKFKSFILSVFWRCAISEHENYQTVDISPQFLELIRSTIVRSSNVSKGSCTVIFQRLTDTKGLEFTEDNLRELVVSPFPRTYEVQGQLYSSISMIFLGFYFEIFLSSINRTHKITKFALGYNKESYTAPFVEIMDISEVLNLFACGLEKEKQGLSNV